MSDSNEGKSVVQTAGRGVLYITFAKLWFLISGWGLIAVLPRLFEWAAGGNEEEGLALWGAYGIVFTGVSFINNGIITGTIQSVSKFTSEDEDRAGAIRWTALWVQGGVGIVLGALYAGFSGLLAYYWFQSPDLAYLMRISAAVIVAYSCYAVFIGSFNGRRMFGRQAAFDVVYAIIKISLMLGLVAAGFEVLGTVLGFITAATIIAVVAGFASRVKGPKTEPFPAKKYLSFASIMIPYTFVLNLLLMLDLFVVRGLVTRMAAEAGIDPSEAALLSDMRAGLYSSAQKLAFIPYQAVLAIGFVVFPLISKATAQNDEKAAKSYVRQALRVSMIVLFALASVFAGVPEQALDLVLGSAHTVSGPALRILSLGVCAFGLMVIGNTILNSAGLPWRAIAVVVTGVLAMVGLVYFLVTRAGYGVELLPAAATGTAIAMTLSLIICGVMVHRRFGTFWPWLSFVRVIAASATAIAAGYFMPKAGKIITIAECAALVVIYLIVLFITREFKGEDLARVKQILKGDEMNSEKAHERWNDSCLIGDIVAMLPGWAAILLIDPWTATVAGLPTSIVMIAVRRILWPHRPVVSRVVIALLMPVVAVFASAAFALCSLGLFGGVLISAALLALVEGWNRRYGRTFLGRFPILTGIVFLLGVTAFSALTLSTGMVKYPTEEFLKSLSAAQEGPEWTAQAKAQALTLAYEVVESGASDDKALDSLVASRSKQMDQLSSMGVHGEVFVTLFDKDGWTARGMSDARDPVLAVAQAASRAAAMDGAKQRSAQKRATDWSSKQTGTFVKIDVAGWDKAVTRRYGVLWLGELARGADKSLKKLEPLEELLNLALEVEPGIDGLILSRDGGETAVMLPDEPVSGGWLSPRQRSGPKKIRKMLKLAWKRNTGKELDLEEPGLSVRKFRTRSFGASGPGEEVFDYYRGNVLLKGDLTREGLVDRIAMAADWLSRRVRTNGRYEYEMVPPHKGSTGAYNLPRHAGSTFGLLAIYNESREEKGLKAAGDRALAAALDAIDYMAANMRSPDPEKAPDLKCFVDERGRASSGSTALGALAVAELPDHRQVEDSQLAARLEAMPVDAWLNGMSECMLVMIDQEGAVFRNYRQSVKYDFVEKEPLYYPGEVAFALVHAYKKTKDEKYLEGARRIADRQLRLHETVLMLDFPWPGDHWIMQALGELSELDVEHWEDYAKLAVLMGKGYVREQYPPQDYKYLDYRGAYRRIVDVPRTTRAGSRGEALAGSVRAARKLGVDPSAFEHALIEGARHLAEQQFVQANSYFVPREWDMEGAVRMGLVDNHVRIDNNQHAMVGMLNGLKAMDGDWE